jgi:hypothetical protein
MADEGVEALYAQPNACSSQSGCHMAQKRMGFAMRYCSEETGEEQLDPAWLKVGSDHH